MKGPNRVFSFLWNLTRQTSIICAAQYSYLPGPHRRAHWAVSIQRLFHPKVQMLPQSSSKHTSRICHNNIPQPGVISFLFRVSIFVVRYHDQMQLSPYTFITEEAHVRGLSEKLKQKPWRKRVYFLIHLACSLCFFIPSRTPCPQMELPIVDQALPHQSLIKKLSRRLVYRQCDRGNSSTRWRQLVPS